MRYKYIRKISPFAVWSWRLASFAFLFLLTILLLYIANILNGKIIYLFLSITVILSVLAIFLSILSFAAFWKRGDIAGKRALFGFIFSLLMLILVIYMVDKSRKSGADISTNLMDSPEFIEEIYKDPGNKLIILNNFIDGKDKDYSSYNVTGRRYMLSSKDLTRLIVDYLDDKKIKSFTKSINIKGQKLVFIQANINYPIFSNISDIIIRIIDEGDTSFLDMRSKYSRGEPDFGLNLYIVKKLLQELDNQIIFLPLHKKDSNFIVNQF
ncbi:hypothetical protein [Bartonella sp. DGB1]|uniref:hypothetical protein n=1 Tax=Bartonella sp. DGB1 TaxID=3239807 RepID=UPI003525F934